MVFTQEDEHAFISNNKFIDHGNEKMRSLKVIIEKHSEGYVAYPLGLEGVVVDEGETYEKALENAKSAIKFHIETFGGQMLDIEEIEEAFIAEVTLQ